MLDQHHAVLAILVNVPCGAANQAQGVEHQLQAVPAVAVGVYWVELGLNEHHDVPAAGAQHVVLAGELDCVVPAGEHHHDVLAGDSFGLVML